MSCMEMESLFGRSKGAGGCFGCVGNVWVSDVAPCTALARASAPADGLVSREVPRDTALSMEGESCGVTGSISVKLFPCPAESWLLPECAGVKRWEVFLDVGELPGVNAPEAGT
jgi:hypothetical protein